MNILIVTQYFWPENFRINDLVKGLVESGDKVTILTGIPNYPSGRVEVDFSLSPGRFSSYVSADVIRLPHILRGSTRLQLALNYISFTLSALTLGLWKTRSLSPDVIFVFGASPVTVALAAVAIGSLKRVKVLLWVLDLWPESLSLASFPGLRIVKWIVRRLVGFIYSRSSLILGQSHAFCDEIRKYTKDKSKVVYLPGWAESEFSNGSLSGAEAISKDIKKDKFNILFAGNLGEAQDLESILKAAVIARSNESIYWTIVGGGSKLEWLRSEVIRLNLQTRVSIYGQVPITHMPEIYKEADILLVALRSDPVFQLTIPGKVQTYMRVGKPILGMIDGEGARVLKESNSGIVCNSGDSLALAAAAELLSVMSPYELDILGKNSRSYAEQNFDRERLIAQIRALMASRLK